MADYRELILEEGTAVRLQLTAVEETGLRSPGPRELEEARPGDGEDAVDLPDGFGEEVPVGVGGRPVVATLAADTLRSVLRPLGPLLQEVHDSITVSADPPDEISVEFGVQE